MLKSILITLSLGRLSELRPSYIVHLNFLMPVLTRVPCSPVVFFGAFCYGCHQGQQQKDAIILVALLMEDYSLQYSDFSCHIFSISLLARLSLCLTCHRLPPGSGMKYDGPCMPGILQFINGF
jgi:hypothetical protein